MNINLDCVEGNLPSQSNELKVLIAQLQREIKELEKETEATLLRHDGKIAELVLYLKNNLSNSIRCLLDDMLSSGELEKIITDTLLYDLNQKIYYVESASLLRESTYFEGDVIRTLGNKQMGDGGSALYKVRVQSPDEDLTNGNLIPLVNGNVAELVKESDSINLKQLGCIGDGKTDYTNVLKYALANYNNVEISDGTYIISDTLDVKSNTTITLVNTKIKSTTGVNKKYIFNVKGVSNVVIKGMNATLEFNKPTVVQQACIMIADSTNVLVEGLTLNKAGGDGLTICGSTSVYSKNIQVVNCVMDGNYRQGISFVGGVDGCLVDRCRFTNTGNAEPGAGIDIETWMEDLYNRNITIQNCYFKNNYQHRGVLVFEFSENIEIINNNFDNENISVKLNNAYIGNSDAIPKNILVKNNILKGCTIFFMNMRGEFDVSDNYMTNSRVFIQSTDSATQRETHSPATIMNNTIDCNGQTAVNVENVGNLIVKGNIIKNCSVPLATIGGRNIEFKDNLIYNYNKSGNQNKIFELATTDRILIEGNTLINNDSTIIDNVLIVQANVRNLIFRKNNLIKCAFKNLLNGYSGAGLEGIAYDNITAQNICESINVYLPQASEFFAGCVVQKKESGIINNYICKYDTNTSKYAWIKL